jgi:NAD+ kinase
MSDGFAVGVVGADTAAVEAAIRAVDARPVTGPAATVCPDSDAVVAVGEPALLAVARLAPDVPVLPVAAGRGVGSVPESGVETAVAALVAGDYTVETHPLVDVRVADRTTATVLYDVMLVSAEPAQISEYTVRAGGERIARFRADGVVVATPAGSSGYASAAGGPVVAPSTAVATIVPVAPFATDANHWVVPLEDVTVAVERDETTVQLVADDRAVGPVDPADPVRVGPGDSVDVAVVEESVSPYGV